MASFTFEARDAAGRVVRGSEVANDEAELDRMLRGRELLLVTAREGRPSRRRANTRSLIEFCYHLATIIEAGIPLLEGLRDLRDDGDSPIAREIEEVARRVESGQLLSQAMAAHPELFPELVRSLVAAGEETGTLDTVLRRLSEYLTWREDLRRKVVGAATYPAIVVTGLVGLVVLLLTVVLPQFLELFTELDVELPLATRLLIALEWFARSWGLHLVAVLAVLGLAAAAWVRTAAGRLRFDALCLRLPVVGRILSMIEMSRLAHNLGLVYAAGVPITRCMELAAGIVQNRAVREVVTDARARIAHGDTLAASLADSDLMPPMVRRMVALGEQSATLDRSLGHVATYYDREVPEAIDRLIAFVNTGVVAALGLTLGTVAFAIFVPLYRMMGNING
ncbi:MAG: type II secretion system F family protein [Myxococcota bacterium]